MKLFQIDGFHKIDGVTRMPGIDEHSLYPSWDDTLKRVVWNDPTKKRIYIKSITTVGDVTTIEYVYPDNSIVTIVYNNGADITLPGNTKILFDDNDSIGGDSAFVYDKVNHKVILSNSKGISAIENTMDATVHNILQFVGNKSLFINTGSIKTPSSNISDVTAIGFNALESVSNATKTIAIGPYAGANTANNIHNNVYVGPYAGRLNQTSNKLFIHNADFSTINDFINKSLIYGDFLNGIVNINNRLAVRNEVKIGAFNVVDTPAGGMVQFVTGGVGKVKPQYYDNDAWVDFANSTEYHLTDVDVTDNGDDTITLTFIQTGLADIEVTIPSTISIPGNDYDIQYKNEDGKLGASAKFNANPVTEILGVDGVIALAIKQLDDFTAVDGAIVNTGTHAYIRLADGFVQIDNERTNGQTNNGENVGTLVPLYRGMNPETNNLQFYNIGGDLRIHVTAANADKDVIITLDYDVYGENAGVTGIPLYKGVTNTDTESILSFKRLTSSDASIIFTEYADRVDIVAISGGASSGEPNNGENVGLGEGRIWDEVNEKNGLNILFRTIKQGTNIAISTNTVLDIVQLDVVDLVQAANNVGADGIGIYKDYTGTNTRTLNLKKIKGAFPVEVSEADDVITVSFPTGTTINSFEGVLDPTVSIDDKVLTWHLAWTPDVNHPEVTGEKDIIRLIIGDNLIYDTETKTLSAIGGTSDSLKSIQNLSITRNIDGSVDRDASSRTVRFTKNSDQYLDWENRLYIGDVWVEDIGLGWLAFENSLLGAHSITGTGIHGDPFKLVNDLESDTPFLFYSTNGLGIRGFYPLPGIDVFANLTDLLDCPDTYDDSGLKYLRVKADLSGIEFATVTGGTGIEAFLELTDVQLDSFDDIDGYAIYVNGAGLSAKAFPTQVAVDWNSIEGVTMILNKPSIPVIGYKEYHAFVSQVATADPVCIVLKNNIGSITATRVGVGTYNFTSSALFTVDKTAPIDDIMMDQLGNMFTLNRLNDSTIQLKTYAAADLTILADDILVKRYINFLVFD